jgi:hypothetical protein
MIFIIFMFLPLQKNFEFCQKVLKSLMEKLSILESRLGDESTWDDCGYFPCERGCDG